MLKRALYGCTNRPYLFAAFNYPVANHHIDDVIDYVEPTDELFYEKAAEAIDLPC